MRKAVLTLWIVVAGAMAGFAAAPAAPATPAPEAKPEKGTEAPAQLKMDEIEIRGELERPEVFYIIPRRKAKMDLGTLSKNYDTEIMEPLLPGPFEARYGIGAQRGE